MNKSESIKNLAVALAKFQGKVSNPSNSKRVSAGKFSYKYAPLDEILNLVRPLLSENGLSIIQAPMSSEGNVSVSTILLHDSGEYIELEPITLKMDKITAQGAGSAITYARRYALSAVLGIASEDDDDANSIEPNNAEKDKQEIINNSLASDKQLQYLYRLSKQKGFDSQMSGYIKKTYNRNSSKELTKQEASEIIQMLGEM